MTDEGFDEDSEEQRQWNRDHHGETAMLRFPTVVTDKYGDLVEVGMREVPVTLNTDPDSDAEVEPSPAFWLEPGEKVVDELKGTDDE